MYKLLNKNKDTICNTMNEGKIKLSDSLAHKLKTLVKKEDQNGTSELQTTDQGEESEQGKESQLERRPTAETGTQDKEGNTCMMEVDVDSTEVPSQGQERSDSLEIFGKENNLQSSGRMLVAPSDDAVVWDPYFPDKVKVCTMSILDYLHGMETRLFDAHLPIEVCFSNFIPHNDSFVPYVHVLYMSFHAVTNTAVLVWKLNQNSIKTFRSLHEFKKKKTFMSFVYSILRLWCVH